MVSKTVTVINEQGLHMRPAGILANGKTIAAKAVMQIMAACMKKGCEVEIVCDGANEQAVLDEISKLFEDGFGE